MKNLLASTAIALALAAGSAFAADLPSRKEAPVYVPPPPPPPMWTGFYVGLNIGGGWSANSNNNSYLPYADTTFQHRRHRRSPAPARTCSSCPAAAQTNSNTGGVVGGGQVGYNYQINQFVIGAEADIQGTSISGGNQGNYAGLYTSPYPRSATGLLTPLATGNGGNLSLPWFGTVRGRVGYLVTPTLLLYGTAGFAYGGVDALPAIATPPPAGRLAAAPSGCSPRIGRRRSNISMSISTAAESTAPSPAGSWATTIIRSSTSCAPA